jgi:hypothetical protein
MFCLWREGSPCRRMKKSKMKNVRSRKPKVRDHGKGRGECVRSRQTVRSIQQPVPAKIRTREI